MTNFRNLKIAINDKQPLDEVVRELERLVYRCDGYHPYYCNYIVCCDDGTYCMYTLDADRDEEYKLTTLAELKEM